jgi:hypothetical protein
MTSGLKDFQNFINEKRKRGEDIKIPKTLYNSENDNFSKPESDFQQRKADIIEEADGKLKLKKVQIKTEKSGFSYFLDGIERKKILCYLRSIPVIYGYVGAAVLKRTDKTLHSTNLEIGKGTFYIPVKEDNNCPAHYLDLKEIEKIKNYENVGKYIKKGTIEGYPKFPDEFIQQAHSEIQEKRRKIEVELTDKWLNSKFDDGWLFVDGTLNTKSQNVLESSNIAGIVKSHGVYYFPFEKMYELYSMEKGQRSSVFQPYDRTEKKKDVFTWYLRLHHDKRNGVNDFGIIRVEIPAKQELLSRVDEISSWILLETKPVGFPASRWDRMIYPIKYCEDYLKSKAPTWTMIESLS